MFIMPRKQHFKIFSGFAFWTSRHWAAVAAGTAGWVTRPEVTSPPPAYRPPHRHRAQHSLRCNPLQKLNKYKCSNPSSAVNRNVYCKTAMFTFSLLSKYQIGPNYSSTFIPNNINRQHKWSKNLRPNYATTPRKLVIKRLILSQKHCVPSHGFLEAEKIFKLFRWQYKLFLQLACFIIWRRECALLTRKFAGVRVKGKLWNILSKEKRRNK